MLTYLLVQRPILHTHKKESSFDTGPCRGEALYLNGLVDLNISKPALFLALFEET